MEGVLKIRSERRLARILVALALVVAVSASVPGGSLDSASAAVITAPGPIAIGDTVTGDVFAGEVDTYSLFVSSAGATVVLRVSGNACDCQWSLSGPNGTVFDQAAAGFGPAWLAPGDYSLVVTSTAAGSYAFDVVSAPAPQSFTTSLGTTVGADVPAAGAGNIESPGAEDEYTLTVPSGGANVVMSVLANECTCTWSLRVANGPFVIDRTAMADTRIGLAAAVYSLRVKGSGAATGTYSFATNVAPAASRFTVALGDTVSSGNPGPGAGDLESPGALDVYAFTATGGQRVSVTGSACSVNAWYALAAPSGRMLLRAAVCGPSNVITLPAGSGTYEVRVSTDTSETGSYAFRIATSSNPPTVAVPVADVFTVGPGTTVANGAPAAGAGNIEVADEHDMYLLNGSAGQVVVLEDKTAAGCSGLVWSAFAPDGAPLVVDHPLGCPASRSVRLNQTGRYTLDVRGASGATGTYSFAIRLAPAAQQFAIALGSTVNPGVPATGAGNLEVPGAVDVYTFAATAGQSIVLSDATAGGCGPIFAVLVSADETRSGPVQLGCGGNRTLAVDRTGTFTVLVAAVPARTGGYSLQVAASPAAATALTVAKLEGAVRLTWTAPTATGGSPITNAQIAVFDANGDRPSGVTGAWVRTVGSAVASFKFWGLTNGVSYRFVVREQNANGLGVPSVHSAAIAPLANTRPNILFILTDDQRFDSIAQLPKLNAEPDWLRFTNSFVNEPMCCPSRASIFTGRYSHHTHVETLLQGENLDDRTTIATMLRSVGYRTGFLGKYLNGYPFASGHPVPPGWDNFEAYESFPNYYGYKVNRNGTLVTYGGAPADYSTDVWTARAETFIRSADAAKPFFLEVAYNAPHASSDGTPTPAPRDVGACAGNTFPLPVSFNAHDEISEPAWLASQPLRNASEMRALRRETCETLRSVDDGVSALIDLLESIGRLSNTYIVLTSDNGYEFGEHSLAGKGDLFEESIRVPLIVRGPGIGPGTVNRLTSNIDLVPTFLDWAKKTPPADFVDGVSWAANARGATSGTTSPTEVLLRGCRSNFQQADPPCGPYPGPAMGMNWGLRTASYKYVEYPSGYRQLFDVVRDPYELRNLANDPAKATIISNLHSRLVARRGF